MHGMDVEQYEEYLHDRAKAWGLEREVDIEDYDPKDLAPDEQAYWLVKPAKKPGKKRLVRLVHKQSKSNEL
jgi:hypothetical protein